MVIQWPLIISFTFHRSQIGLFTFYKIKLLELITSRLIFNPNLLFSKWKMCICGGISCFFFLYLNSNFMMYLSWDESSRLPLISIKVYVFHIVPECHALIWRTQISNFTLWDEPMGWLQLPLLVHVIEDIFILKRVSRGPFKLGKPNLQNSTVFSIVGHSGSPSCIYSLRFFFFFLYSLAREVS